MIQFIRHNLVHLSRVVSTSNYVQCFTYVGPGHVEIVDMNVFIEEERSQMKVTLRKVRLLL